MLLALALLNLQGCEKKAGGTVAKKRQLRSTLSFYHIPECFLCAELRESLAELKKIHSRDLIFQTVDYHHDASQRAIERFNLGTHGIVVTSPDGDELWSMQAHYQEPGSLSAAISRLTQ